MCLRHNHNYAHDPRLALHLPTKLTLAGLLCFQHYVTAAVWQLVHEILLYTKKTKTPRVRHHSFDGVFDNWSNDA